jgi:hypothetical protein
VVLAIVLVVAIGAGIHLIVRNAGRLGAIKLEETRTPLPGRRNVRLDTHKYIVWYETRRARPSSEPSVEIAPRDGEPALALNDYGGTFTTDSGGRHSEALWTVTPPSAGWYVMTVAGDSSVDSYDRPGVVLGQPIGRRVLRVVVGGIVALLATAGLVVLVVLSTGRRRRPPPPTATDAFGR